MRHPRLQPSTGIAVAFAVGFIVASATSARITGAAAPTSADALANSQAIRRLPEPDASARPAPVQVTPPATPEQVTVQQQLTALDEALFGPPRLPGGRPRAIPHNVIGDLRSQIETLQNANSDGQSKVLSQLSAIQQQLTQLSAREQQLTQLAQGQAAALTKLQDQVIETNQRLVVTCAMVQSALYTATEIQFSGSDRNTKNAAHNMSPQGCTASAWTGPPGFFNTPFIGTAAPPVVIGAPPPGH